MQKEKKVLMLVNWKNRDLRGVIQTGTVLENMGFNIKYTNHRNTLWNIYRFKPELVVFPQVIAEKDKALLSMKMGALNCVIRSEGTVTPKSKNAIFKFDHSAKIDLLSDLYIVWGEGMKELFIEHTDVNPSKIHVCGNPRFDIYREPLSELLENNLITEKTSLTKDKPMVLFASNFVYLDKERKMGRKNLGEEYERYVKSQTILYEKCMENLIKYFQNNPEIQLLLKPHPLELKDKYKDLLKLENVDYIENIDMSLILNDIDILLHTGSTTSLEACVLEKPIITLMFEDIGTDYMTDNIKDLPKADSYSKLQELLDRYIQTKKLESKYQDKQLDFIQKWFYKIDGKSTLRCAETIDKFLVSSEKKRSRRKVSIKELFQICLSSPIGVSLITLMSRVKHLGKKIYYQEVEERENCRKQDIAKMKTTIGRIYESSDYFS